MYYRSSGSESDEGEEEEVSDVPEDLVDSDDEEEEDASAARPYLSLMRSLAEDAPRNAKRRKLDHSETQEPPQQQSLEESSKEEDDEKDEAANEDVDHVDEPEEAPEDAPVEDLFDDDDDLDSSDPFETHFSAPNDDVMTTRVKDIQNGKWQLNRVAQNSWRFFVNTPGTGHSDAELPKPIGGPADLKLKKKLQESVLDKWTSFDQAEKLLAPVIFNNLDTLFCERTVANAPAIRRMACVHALNHVFK